MKPSDTNLEANEGGLFQVAEWQVDPATLRVRRGHEVVKLEPKVVAVLAYLARHAGEVVKREDLERAVWPNTVIGYDAVTNTVIKLRKALQDDFRNPRIIETIPKKGYRLIAEVTAGHAEAPDNKWSSIALKNNRRMLVLLVSLLIGAAIYLAVSMMPAQNPKAVSRDHPPSLASTPPVSSSLLDAIRIPILVLPFVNVSGEPAQNYFVDGITEDIITDLTKISGLSVVSRSVAFAYKNETARPIDIANELGARFLVMGSVRKSSDRVRITSELIDAKTGYQLWSERYDAVLKDIFSLQDDTAKQIVSALRLELSARERTQLTLQTTHNPQAYDRLLRARAVYPQWTEASNRQAEEFYRQALTLDPSYAEAYAGLANVHFQRFILSVDKDKSLLEAGEVYAQRAIESNQDLPQGYMMLGWLKLWQKQHEEAIRWMQRAVEIDPNYVEGIARLSEAYTFAGQFEKGLSYIRWARGRTPVDWYGYGFWAGEAKFYLNKINEAIADLEMSVRLNPRFYPARRFLAAAYVEAGRLDEARAQIDEVLQLNPTVSITKLRRELPFKHPADLERQLTALKLAGLPE